MDYCGTGCNNITANGTAADAEDKRVVRLKFLRDQLLYDIKNYARLPIDPVITTMVDAGEVEAVSGEYIAPIVDAIQKES